MTYKRAQISIVPITKIKPGKHFILQQAIMRPSSTALVGLRPACIPGSDEVRLSRVHTALFVFVSMKTSRNLRISPWNAREMPVKCIIFDFTGPRNRPQKPVKKEWPCTSHTYLTRLPHSPHTPLPQQQVQQINRLNSLGERIETGALQGGF